METNSSKNVGPFLAFDENWFERHQKILLWLLNSRITKRWFRWVLRIRKHDIGYDALIVKVLPNCYTVFNKWVDDEKAELSTDFRTHPKYAKRLYFAFKPFWWAMHAWDWLVADRFIPAWSYGFTTLTAFPDAGDPGTTTVDGAVGRLSGEVSLATIRAGAGTFHSSINDPDGPNIQSGTNGTGFTSLSRGIATFDTSSIGATPTISSVVLSLHGGGTGQNTNALGSPALHIASATPASNTTLANSDYGNVGTTSFANIAYASYSETAYNDFTLNASGISNVNQTGVSKFSFQLSWDINNSFTGTLTANNNSNIAYNTADHAGTASDPKLVVTYSVASGLTSMWLPANNQPIFEQVGITSY